MVIAGKEFVIKDFILLQDAHYFEARSGNCSIEAANSKLLRRVISFPFAFWGDLAMNRHAMNRQIYNFSAGPAVMPAAVLERAKDEMRSVNGIGMSVMEISHRSRQFGSPQSQRRGAAVA